MARDAQFQHYDYHSTEIAHNYGRNVHIFLNPLLLTYLARLGNPNTRQPGVSALISNIYWAMTNLLINNELATKNIEVLTRMETTVRNRAIYEGPIIDPDQKVVIANIVRSGLLPAQLVYQKLTEILSPALVRQDHLTIEKDPTAPIDSGKTQVIQARVHGSVQDALVVIPEPTGATGSIAKTVLDIYTEKIPNHKNIPLGTPRKMIILSMIITPEFIRKIQAEYPEAVIYAARLDRGLSDDRVLQAKLGEYVNVERGLTSNGEIVPGLGNICDILNNTNG